MAMKDADFQKRIFFVNALLPALLLTWDWWRGNLGANPVEAVTRTTGVLALVFLAITLMVTPLQQVFGWAWIVKQRRQLGLFSFFYACLHLLTYIAFDRGGDLTGVPADIVKRPFIAVGMIAFVLLIPLAVTSTNAMIRRMGGKNWKLLHKLTFVAIVLGVIHFWMIVKSDISYPLMFAAAAFVLLSYRFQQWLKKPKKKRAAL